MKNVTQVLSEEHQIILKVIDAVLHECRAIENGKPFDSKYFIEVIDFIKNYADKFHHAKEEDILFKAMLESIENLHCNPIPTMLHEHEAGRDYVKGMEEGLSISNANQVVENAIGYCSLLQNHIYKEDNVLYPMAEEALSDEEKDMVLKRYSQVEKSFTENTSMDKYINFQL